ncbi:MAG: DNA translocase FtsK, partial [Oscillospiraceae bacterium]|nr:DNA translocase FtsK [Oscillospiraceae bacterium]
MAQQKKKATSKAKAAPRRQNRKKRPIRREVGGILCALFALCVAVSYIEKEAFLVRHLSQLFRGLLGYGYYLTVPSLLLAAYILLFHRGRPVRLRLFCALVMPVLVGTLAHIAGSDMGNTSLSGAIPTLWASGIELTSGGVLSGALAFGLFKLLGTVASVIVLSLVLVICLLGALHLTIGSIIAAIRSHERLEYEEEAYEEVLPRRTKPVESKQVSAPKAPIDIPLEGEKKKSAGAKSGFFAAKSDEVRTPDELLAPRKEEPLSVEPVGEKDAEKPPVAVEKPAAEKPVESKKIAANDLQAETEKVTGEIEQELAGEQSEYHYPPITLLEEGGASNAGAAGAELRNNSRRLADTLRSFGVDAKAGDVVRGPSVTRYEFTLDQGVKLSKITNLQDDIALALGASGVRIAPIPDKISVVGIEVPNKLVSAVRIRDVLESRDFVQHSSSVAFAVGKDIGGKNIVGNIAKLPHVLIAGTTGSGKSVCTNSLIVSLLYKSTPEDVRFIMVDPKMVELAPYNGIPHLLIPVVTDPKKAAGALQWAVYEMMKRYKMFSEHNVKDLAGYNTLAGVTEDVKKLPSVVVVIDELADLMLVAAKEVEESICRVAQMGRAAGMHL